MSYKIINLMHNLFVFLLLFTYEGGVSFDIICSDITCHDIRTCHTDMTWHGIPVYHLIYLKWLNFFFIPTPIIMAHGLSFELYFINTTTIWFNYGIRQTTQPRCWTVKFWVKCCKSCKSHIKSQYSDSAFISLIWQKLNPLNSQFANTFYYEVMFVPH